MLLSFLLGLDILFVAGAMLIDRMKGAFEIINSGARGHSIRTAATTAGVTAAAATSGETEDTEEDTRVAAPDVAVQNADGDRVTLSELFGKPLMLNFWVSWCPPCKSEMPEFNSAYEDMRATLRS